MARTMVVVVLVVCAMVEVTRSKPVADKIKENEKKLKTLEAELMQIQEDLGATEHARRAIEQERDESAKSAFSDERKRYETTIANLEEELEEERIQTELMQDKVKRTTLQLEQMNADLISERAACQNLDNARMTLERQNKDLIGKLADMESSLRSRSKNTIANLESKVNNLEIQLDEEAKERQQLTKAQRKSDKRIKDLLMQIEEERSHTEFFKQQVEKTNTRVKNMKRQLDESEEEVTKLNGAKRKLQRDLDENIESLEAAQREVINLRQRLKSSTSASSRDVLVTKTKRNQKERPNRII